MALSGLDHISVRTTDVEATQAFYEKVLGLQAGPRPNFSFPGAWLYRGEQAVVHVIGVDAHGRGEGAAGAGGFDHIAFAATDLDGMRKHFEASGVAFDERGVPGMRLHQIFLTDPNGLRIELNFAV